MNFGDTQITDPKNAQSKKTKKKEEERKSPKIITKTNSPMKYHPFFPAIAFAGIIAGAVIIISFKGVSDHSLLCSLAGSYNRAGDYSTTPTQLHAILHYATSKIVPQQSIEEIRISYNVLLTRSPCNFLVFGLGYDSQMWESFNPRGTTLFLEESSEWVRTVLKDAPNLQAHTVNYRTQLKEADDLFKSYRSVPSCSPEKAYLRGNTECKLALTGLPDKFYDTEWDLIMIDAPRGYFPEAPGRMGAIFSAAVMARARKGPGITHVFLHDVDRKVEKMYANEFLCKKYLVKGVGRLWHFEIPSAVNSTTTSSSFC